MLRIFLTALGLQQIEICAQVRHAGVERLDRAMGASLHHATFHDREYEFGEGREICVGRQRIPGVFEAFGDGSGPAVEVVGEALVDAELFFGNFESQAADGAAVGATSSEKIAAIEVEDAEDAFDRIGDGSENRFDDDGKKRFDVKLEDGEKEFFFGLEEEIEAAGVGLGALANLGDAGSGVTAKPEEIESGVDDTAASVTGCPRHT